MKKSKPELSPEALLTKERIRQLRREKGWSWEVATKRTGLGKKTLQNFENDNFDQDPIGITLRKLVKGYDTTLGFIAGESAQVSTKVLTAEEHKYLEICRDAFMAARLVREATDKNIDAARQEYEAALKYRQEYERIVGIDVGFAEEGN